MEAQKQSKPWYKKIWVIVLLTIFGGPIVLATIFGMATGVQESMKTSNKPQQTAQPKPESAPPSYEIKIVGNTYSSSTTRMLTFTVKNTGSKESNPACNVTLDDESGTYRGYDYATWNTQLAPGDSKYFEGQITITNEGAAYATKSHVSCVERAY